MKRIICLRLVVCGMPFLSLMSQVESATAKSANPSRVEAAVASTAVASTIEQKVDLRTLSTSMGKSLNLALEVAQAELKKTKRSMPDSMRLRFAISLLGKYHSEEAIEFLVDNVGMKVNGMSLALVAFGNYPFVTAAIETGNSSVQEILRRMKPLVSTSPEYPERDLHLFAYIIRQVDGDEVGLYRLRLAAKDAQGTHKINLINLIDIYKLNEDEFQIRRAIEGAPPTVKAP